MRGWRRGSGLGTRPAGHGGQDDQRVVGSHGGVEAVEYADVLVVEVHVDVAVEAAVGAEQLRLRLRMSLSHGAQDLADGGSVGEILRSVAEQHPDTESQLFAPDGGLNRYVNVYLNDEDVRVLDGLETAVKDADSVVILPAMAGGAA